MDDPTPDAGRRLDFEPMWLDGPAPLDPVDRRARLLALLAGYVGARLAASIEDLARQVETLFSE